MTKTDNFDTKKRQRTVSGKLLTFLVPMITVAIIIMIIIVSNNARRIITEQAQNGLQQEARANAAHLSTEITEIKSYLEAVANSVETVSFENDQAVTEYLIPTMSQFASLPNGLYIGTEDGSYFIPSGWVPPKDYVSTERDWYKDGIGSDVFVQGQPYLDSQTGGMIVSFSRKITLPDGRYGVGAVDMQLDEIVADTESFKPMGTGETILLDGGMILSYTDGSFNGDSVSAHSEDGFLSAIAEYVQSGADGTVTKVKGNDGEDYYVSFNKVSGTSWTLISSVAKEQVLSDLNHFVLISFVVAVIVILLIAVLMRQIILGMISKPVGTLTKNISKITEGDFRVDIQKGGNDEIGTMNDHMHDYVQTMREIIGNIQNVTTHLSNEAENSRTASDELNEQSKDQYDSMEQIKNAMDGMVSTDTNLSQNAASLAMEMSELSKKGGYASETVTSLVNKAMEGQRDIENVQKGMEIISGSVTDMNSVVTVVGESAQRIKSIIEMITSIASQTNLLSLNASIEAARAGEAGKGFAVVADEIGQLANESGEAATQISTIVQDITTQIGQLSLKSENNMQEINTNVESVTIAGNTFEEILRKLDETSLTVQDMIEKINNLDDIAASVATISEEQSASTQEVLATTESLAESAGKVASRSRGVDESANIVSQSAKQIEDIISTFTIE